MTPSLRCAERAIALAEASGDDYVIVQVLNVLGAVSFDRATSKLNLPHARSHLSSARSARRRRRWSRMRAKRSAD